MTAVGSFPALPTPNQGCRFVPNIFLVTPFNIDCGLAVDLFPALLPPPTLCNMQSVYECECGCEGVVLFPTFWYRFMSNPFKYFQ